jgi:hypothetical protein
VRWFHTGDLARLGEHGAVEFFGRRDRQVKVRGQRVELGEVEGLLLGHPSVAEAYVCATEREHGLELAAFVAGAGGLDSDELTRHLARALPAAAVPAQVTIVPELPRTASGKVDQMALRRRAGEASPAPKLSEPRESRSVEHYRRVLSRLWQEVLGRRVHPDRSFFAQGGHSLHALRLVDRIAAELPDEQIAVTHLFRLPTITAMAAWLAGRHAPLEVVENSAEDRRLSVLLAVQRGEIAPDEALTLLEAT